MQGLCYGFEVIKMSAEIRLRLPGFCHGQFTGCSVIQSFLYFRGVMLS